MLMSYDLYMHIDIDSHFYLKAIIQENQEPYV